MALLEMYDEFMRERADSRVRHWPMMDTPLPTLAIIGVYLLLVLYILPNYMKNRKPMNLTRVIRVYNIIQVISCILVIYRILTAGWLQGEYSYGCAPINYSNEPNPVRMLSAFYWIYWLKGVELIETVFFALRKKFSQISSLHVYHHSSTFFLAYIGCKFMGGGMSSVPIMLNSFIHVLMYTYYYLSSLGPDWQKKLKPWKPRLTMCQMVQFTVLILHALTALQPGCTIPKGILLIWLPNVVVIFKMFYDFYMNSYSKSPNYRKNSSQNGVKANKKRT